MYSKSFNHILLNALVILLTGLLLSSCDLFPPTSKDDYIKREEAFFEKVKEKHSSKSKDQWESFEEKSKKYYEDYYTTFKDELTVDESIKIRKHAFLFKYYTGKVKVKDIFKGKYTDEIKDFWQDLKKEIKE